MSASGPRLTARMDSGWLFCPGEGFTPVVNTHIAAYMANKAGWARGPAKPDYDDSDWRLVDLPHDWSVEGPFDPNNHLANGYLPRGFGWYRRHFALEEKDRGQYLALQFDGVAGHCAVFVNGHLLHRNFCGYTPFTVDFSDVANFDRLNVVAVKVDANPIDGWWYEGAGIYRHAWLIGAGAVHFAPDSLYACPRKILGQWHTDAEVTIVNSSDDSQEFRLSWSLSDEPTTGTIPARSSRVMRQRMEDFQPRLWSLEDPHLYTLTASLDTDCLSVRFGYRTIRFDPAEGFFLNDERVKLKGTCNHQDHAGLGVAVPDSIHRFRIKRLKEMGANAYRAAHNPPAAELLDACDELGMLVWDENRTFGSSPEHVDQLTAMVKRDRNHPSVILWSICNEEAIQGSRQSAAIARSMIAAVKQLDDTRPVGAAVSGGILNDDCIAAAIEVMGINYQIPMLDAYHEKHPHIPIIAAETHCSLSTRGVYQTDPAGQVFASYDEEKATWGISARDSWRAVQSRRFVAGLFAWTGFDYRGEPTPHAWPSVTSHWGIMDLCGFAKDAFYLHKAYFTSAPFIHLAPHWNWEAGQTIRVITFTNCEEAEVFVNGNSRGRRPIDPIEMAQWLVPFEPGELSAVGYRGGRVACRTAAPTSGAAVAIGLDATGELIPADGEFVFPVTVLARDAAGRRVPTASDEISFSISGPARIAGVGNGDPNSHEPDKSACRSLFSGLAQVLIAVSADPGVILLTATAPGLAMAQLKINSEPASVRPSAPVVAPRHFINDWRMSPISPRPLDPGAAVSDQDMNTWERLSPAPAGQKAWTTAGGYALYRARFVPPRARRISGGRIVFHGLAGGATFFLDGKPVAGPEIIFPPTAQPLTLTLLLNAATPPAGLTGPVEIC